MAETELERAEKRYAQARARLQALKNREVAKERKLDTRRKVILGGALIDLAARDSNASAMLDRLVRNLPREQDRRTFDGWEVKAAARTPAGDAEGIEIGAFSGEDAGAAPANATEADPGAAAPYAGDREAMVAPAAFAAAGPAWRSDGEPR
ncbi:hypothetical protein RM190_22550 [Paracoccus sp. CPCC 101403]|uniref:Mobilization protein n=1 Tax=Paracoccus broussonetiae TaxID=3075834 RepID=A0ABU3EMK3_9RHOB|nr:hypothetical protein [Paracoccus sp. CPCC 101403]MDT1064655.1 hypothetical protein [Paracoccus sp. CPCC 101403]